MGSHSADNCDSCAKRDLLTQGDKSHERHEIAAQLTQLFRDPSQGLAARALSLLPRQPPLTATAKDLATSVDKQALIDWGYLTLSLIVRSRENLMEDEGAASYPSLLRAALIGPRKPSKCDAS